MAQLPPTDQRVNVTTRRYRGQTYDVFQDAAGGWFGDCAGDECGPYRGPVAESQCIRFCEFTIDDDCEGDA